MKFYLCMLTVGFLATLTSTAVLSDDLCSKKDIVNAVNQAVSILEKEGKSGLDNVKEIRFCGDNYVFVNNLENVSLFKHPGIGMDYLFFAEVTNDKVISQDFKAKAKSSKTSKNGVTYYNGAGWQKYRWGHKGKFGPGEAFIKGCLMGNENVYVGAHLNTIESK